MSLKAAHYNDKNQTPRLKLPKAILSTDPGNQAIRQSGNQAIRQSGNQAIRQSGNYTHLLNNHVNCLIDNFFTLPVFLFFGYKAGITAFIYPCPWGRVNLRDYPPGVLLPDGVSHQGVLHHEENIHSFNTVGCCAGSRFLVRILRYLHIKQK